MSRALATALLREQAADPWRCWIRHAPVRWPGPARPWLDLAGGKLGESDGEPEVLTALLAPRLDDVLYLPPVEAELAAARDRLAAQHAARGTPVLVQLLPGDPLPRVPVDVAAALVVVWDLLATALGDSGSSTLVEASPAARAAASTHNAATSVPPAAALWPLLIVAGDDALDAVATAITAADLSVLQGVPLELSGRDRRSLGESLSEERYLRLFHGEPPQPLAIARSAARHGLLPLLPRPLPRPPLRGAGNLRVAGTLAACAELCHLLGEPESRAQALLRAARFAERAEHDLSALAREGNLAVLPWLDGEPLEVVRDAARGAEPALWRELLARLVA